MLSLSQRFVDQHPEMGEARYVAWITAAVVRDRKYPDRLEQIKEKQQVEMSSKQEIAEVRAMQAIQQRELEREKQELEREKAANAEKFARYDKLFDQLSATTGSAESPEIATSSAIPLSAGSLFFQAAPLPESRSMPPTEPVEDSSDDEDELPREELSDGEERLTI
jgi:hypothetical protein